MGSARIPRDPTLTFPVSVPKCTGGQGLGLPLKVGRPCQPPPRQTAPVWAVGRARVSRAVQGEGGGTCSLTSAAFSPRPLPQLRGVSLTAQGGQHPPRSSAHPDLLPWAWRGVWAAPTRRHRALRPPHKDTGATPSPRGPAGQGEASAPQGDAVRGAEPQSESWCQAGGAASCRGFYS